MRTTVVRRTALAACAASLALLATACGGSSDTEGGKSDTASGGDSAPKAPAKALSAADLEKASLVQGDVKGHKITKAGPADEVPADGVKADKEACLPIGHAMFGVAQDGSVATTKRKVITEPKAGDKKSLEDLEEGEAEDVLKDAFDLTSTFVALTSYDKTAGPDAFAALKKAAADCAGGFTATVAGSPTKIVSIVEEKATGGDEAAAWTLTTKDEDGASAPFKLAALRKEGTVATFFAFNLAAGEGGATFTVPTEVVSAQDKKLG